MANALGNIGASTDEYDGAYFGLTQTVASGLLAISSGRKYNAPVEYGTIIKIPGYYNAYLCIAHNASGVWVSTRHGAGEDLNWNKIYQL